MTYSDLLVRLLQLNADQLKKDVMIYDVACDEYSSVYEFDYEHDGDNKLKPNHPYLSFSS